MVSDAVLASLIGVFGSFIVTSVVGVVSYLLKDKIESMEQDIDDMHSSLKKDREQREREHQVVAEWLNETTEALRDEGIDAPKPDAAETTIELDSDA
jgi:hypothetical protein